LRSGSPIYATEDVFQAAGIEIPDQADDQVEAFREFLDQINPEDFLG
jgi:bifunctional DNase/RNase